METQSWSGSCLAGRTGAPSHLTLPLNAVRDSLSLSKKVPARAKDSRRLERNPQLFMGGSQCMEPHKTG